MVGLQLAMNEELALFPSRMQQVGGHMKNDAEPESYVDEEGRFFKPYTVRSWGTSAGTGNRDYQGVTPVITA